MTLPVCEGMETGVTDVSRELALPEAHQELATAAGPRCRENLKAPAHPGAGWLLDKPGPG